MADTTTVIFAIMTVSAVFIIGLSFVIYKCRTDPKTRYIPESYGGRDANESNYRDDTLSEEDQLMIPIDREDTIDSLKQQLSQVNIANVRYIQIASVEKEFTIKNGIEPREYFAGDVITFRDIAIGFVDGIPESKVDEKTNLTKRSKVIYSFCEKQFKCDDVNELSQINDVIIYVCKIIIRLRYNIKRNTKYVSMRDEKSEEFKNDLLPIVEWIWHAKMDENAMDILLFSQNMSQWIKEIESSHKI